MVRGRRRGPSIRGRVTIGAVAIVTIALLAGAFAGVQLMRATLIQSVETSLQQNLRALGGQPGRGPGDRLEGLEDDVLVRLTGTRDGANNDRAARLPSVPAGAVVTVTVDDRSYLAASAVTPRGTVTVARPLASVDDAVGAATRLLFGAVPLVVALVGIVVWFVATRALAPVERLRRQVDAIDATGLSARVDAGRSAELGALARTMNGMLDRIEHSQATQRRFVSDASHELRSPLATIRQHAEIAQVHPEAMSLGDLSRVVRSEGSRMEELVDGLLVLARLDEGRDRSLEPVDLDDIALAEVSRLRGLGIAVDGRGISAGRVFGNPHLLARAARNLVDNAARHARRAVAIRVYRDGGQVVLQVADDGAGIAPGDRERVFDRFTRLDEARARDEGGSGLGLAIVREIALAHGGTAAVIEAAGGGALFSLVLPADETVS